MDHPGLRRRAPLAAAAALLLSGCLAPAGGSGGAPNPQAAGGTAPEPSPTLPALPAPLVDGTAAVVLEPPEFAPTATPTRISLPLPQERLILEAPGPGSQVTSPVRVAGWAGPSFQGKVFVRLIGEQGQEIARTTTYILAQEGAAGLFVVTVPFSISGVAEAGLIEVSTNNLLNNRLDHLAARPVVFLAVGEPRVHTNLTVTEKLTIFSPREDRVVRGGVASVRGGAWVDEDLPLLIEVLDRAGQVVGSVEVPLLAPVVGELGTFEAEVPYTIPHAQYGRIAVIERGLHPPAVRHVTSLRVWLEP